MKKTGEEKALATLKTVCEEIAGGRYQKARQLFELTKEGKYPSLIADLAEPFGMMLVKVETREYRLEGVIDDLKKARTDLLAATERLARENVNLKQSLREKFQPSHILGTSRGMRELLVMVEKLSHTSSSILMTGETGTGKELVARPARHHQRQRTGTDPGGPRPGCRKQIPRCAGTGHQPGRPEEEDEALRDRIGKKGSLVKKRLTDELMMHTITRFSFSGLAEESLMGVRHPDSKKHFRD